MKNPFSLEGKKILVVGASSGIGRAIAKECAEMGATLIVAARTTEALESLIAECPGEGHKVITADITTEEGIKAIIEGVDKINGIAFVSGISELAPIKFCTREKFEKVMGTNFYGHVELTRMLAKKKKLEKSASLVYISSISAYFPALSHAIYGVSKAAINHFMHYCAMELAPNIRANSIAPGMVETKLIREGAISDEELAKDMENYPLKRYGQPEDIANGAVYLLSDASSWVTGHTLVIDGGLTMY